MLTGRPWCNTWAGASFIPTDWRPRSEEQPFRDIRCWSPQRWLFGDVSIRRPIEKLLFAARAWQRGDLTARAALPNTGSEINRLGAAFDEMAEGVQTRDQSLEHQMQNLTRERDRAQELAAIVGASRDAIWRWTVGGTITSWNVEAEHMLGYKSDEIVGKPVLTLNPADRIERAHDVFSKLRQGQAYGPLETVRMHKNGTPIDVELTVSPIRDSEGRITAAATVCRDITERKKAEAVIGARERDSDKVTAAGACGRTASPGPAR